MRRSWPLAALLAICGCNADQQSTGLESTARQSTRFEVDGVAGAFCVPDEQTIPDPWWVPEDKPGTPRGFAFAGCWSDRHRPADCPFPNNVKAGTVHGLNYEKPRTYAGIPADAFLRTVLSEHDTDFAADASGHVVSARNDRLWPSWYIWRVSSPVASGARPTFNDDDELLATCHADTSVQKPLAGTPHNIFCNRSLESEGLWLEYSFESHEEFPTDFSGLDATVLSVIRSWQCAT